MVCTLSRTPALWDQCPWWPASSLPWSQAPRAIRGSPQAPEIQGGLSLLQDPVAPQVPWSHSCQARQACQLFPSLLPGPSVLKVPGHPTRTGSHTVQHCQVLSSLSYSVSRVCPWLQCHTQPPASPSGSQQLDRLPHVSAPKAVLLKDGFHVLTPC